MNRNSLSASLAIGLFSAAIVSSGVAAHAADTGAASTTPAAAEKVAPVPSLDSVQWSGPGVSLSSLKGKTTVIMPFVTWCPKCNTVAPDMLKQLSTAIADKPVVVVAVVTDVDATSGRAHVSGMGLAGPNVLFGANPKMNEELGLDPKSLWTFAMIDPEGKIKSTGAALAVYPDKTYSLSREVSNAKDLGKLQFLTAEMSPAVKNLVWPIEMGDVATLVKVSQPKNLRGLPKEDQQSLQEMSTKFLDDQLASAKELAGGDIPKKIEGFGKATQISAAFGATAQGKEAKKLILELNGDASFKKELAARRLFDQSVAKSGGDDVKLAKSLHVVVQRYPETYYGGLAKQKIDSAATSTPPK